MNLNLCTWKPFITERLFSNFQEGKANQQILTEGGGCFYIGAKRNDNGVMLRCAPDQTLIQPGNCVIFICNGQGSVGYANYMDRPFIGTTDIVAGYNKNLNPLVGAFLATVYSLERPKYSFGRKWKTHLKSTQVMLPVLYDSNGKVRIDDTKEFSDEGFIPDWQFMEDYIKSLHCKPVTTHNSSNGISLDYRRWKEFRLGDLLSRIYKANSYCSEELVECSHYDSLSIPYITRTDTNNGCQFFVKKDDAFRIEAGNAITIGDTTSTIFYQENEFICGDHIVILRSPFFNKFTASFIITLLQKERYRYNYGRAFLKELIENTKLLLPVGIDNNPDWQYMEDYIKSLPYGDRI